MLIGGRLIGVDVKEPTDAVLPGRGVIVQHGAAGSAWLSADSKHRYLLVRKLEGYSPRRLVVIGLNPSTADATKDDPTSTRCKNLARRLGCGFLWMVNLMSYRATYPRELWADPAPYLNTQRSDAFILWAMASSDPDPERQPVVLMAWGGNGGRFRGRVCDVVQMVIEAQPDGLPNVRHLGQTSNGQPRHPGRLASDHPIERWLP